MSLPAEYCTLKQLNPIWCHHLNYWLHIIICLGLFSVVVVVCLFWFLIKAFAKIPTLQKYHVIERKVKSKVETVNYLKVILAWRLTDVEQRNTSNIKIFHTGFLQCPTAPYCSLESAGLCFVDWSSGHIIHAWVTISSIGKSFQELTFKINCIEIIGVTLVNEMI